MRESLKSEHAESYPGRPLPKPCKVEDAKPEPASVVKELHDKQNGSNGLIGN